MTQDVDIMVDGENCEIPHYSGGLQLSVPIGKMLPMVQTA